MIPARDITGLVLAGGQGRRMGGLDKGLQPLPDRAGARPVDMVAPKPLARHALERLAPQVGPLAISANRNLGTYRGWGVPVWIDQPPGLGPLGGIAAALARMGTPWLATVPCDAPCFPQDLAPRLAAAATGGGAMAAMAWHGGRPQPVFCLVHRDLAPTLQGFLAGGGRRAQDWLAAAAAARVDFDRPGLDDGAFFNANTLQDLGPGGAMPPQALARVTPSAGSA